MVPIYENLNLPTLYEVDRILVIISLQINYLFRIEVDRLQDRDHSFDELIIFQNFWKGGLKKDNGTNQKNIKQK